MARSVSTPPAAPAGATAPGSTVLRRLRRRVVPLALAAGLLLTASCGSGSGGGGGADGGKVTLRMSWWGSDSRHAYTQKIIELFEAKNPNITVEPDYSNFDDYWNKLSTGIAGGNAPDVIQQDTKYLRDYAERGAMADLKPYLGRQIADTDLDPAVVKAGEVDGKVYGIPSGVNAYAVMANPALFAQAGVPVPDDSVWTWEQLVATAAAVSKASPKGTYGVQDPGHVDVTLELFARQRGEQLYTADGRIGLTRPTLVAYYTMLAQLRDSGGEPPASLSVEIAPGGVDRSLLATKTGAMAMFWTNQLGALTKAAGTDLKLLRMPGDSPSAGTYFKPAMLWSMNSKTAHPEESAKLIDFLLNDPEVAKLTLSDRGLPVNVAQRAAIAPLLPVADQQAAEFLDKLRDSIAPTPPLPPKGSAKISGTVVKKTYEQLLFKKMTPEQAADSFLSQATAAVGG